LFLITDLLPSKAPMQVAAPTTKSMEQLDNLLAYINPNSDILSNTLHKPPAERKKQKTKNKYKTTKEDEGSTTTGSIETMEDLAAACLPDAYDLWKLKYRYARTEKRELI